MSQQRTPPPPGNDPDELRLETPSVPATPVTPSGLELTVQSKKPRSSGSSSGSSGSSGSRNRIAPETPETATQPLRRGARPPQATGGWMGRASNLVSLVRKDRQLRFLAAFVCFGLLLILGSAVAIAISLTSDSGGKTEFSLLDSMSSSFRRNRFDYSFSKEDDEIVFTRIESEDENKGLFKYSVEPLLENRRSIFWTGDYENLHGIDLRFSSHRFVLDRRYVLITTEATRRKGFSEAIYAVLDNANMTAYCLTNSSTDYLNYATIDPTGTYWTIVRDYDVYLRSIEWGNETRITYSGEESEVHNGARLSSSLNPGSIFWNKDGTQLAFLQYNASQSEEFTMVHYDDDEAYVDEIEWVYTKAGFPRPDIALFVYSMDDQTLREVDLGNDDEQYVQSVRWDDQEHIYYRLLSRRQHEQAEYLVNIFTGVRERLRRFRSTNGWIDIRPYINLGDTHLRIFPNDDGYQHIGEYTEAGKWIRWITSGPFDVIGLVRYIGSEETIYYYSTEHSPLARDVFTIFLNGTGKQALVETPGYYTITFSPSSTFYILSYEGPGIPWIQLQRKGSGKPPVILEDNAEMRELIPRFRLPRKEYRTFPGAEGDLLNGLIYYPPGFTKKKDWPMVMYVYNGPDSQTVTYKHDIDWHDHLSALGIVVVIVDGRGTANRGDTFLKAVYRQLGILETADALAVAQFMSSMSWIDSKRMGIWGWSYGGYMALMILSDENNIFKTGIAVAPVTDWSFYHSQYSERYMGTPLNNRRGYTASSVLSRLKNLNSTFLVLHGLEDDNVHFQHTAVLVDEMITKEKTNMRMFVYPNRDHNINGGFTSEHLYKTMRDHWLTEFGMSMRKGMRRREALYDDEL